MAELGTKGVEVKRNNTPSHFLQERTVDRKQKCLNVYSAFILLNQSFNSSNPSNYPLLSSNETHLTILDDTPFL